MSLIDLFRRQREQDKPNVRIEVQDAAQRPGCPECGAPALDITTQESACLEFMCAGSPAHFWSESR